jgi:outer membrane protein assembly factor BamA/mono/diheme cytochrome c family protein
MMLSRVVRQGVALVVAVLLANLLFAESGTIEKIEVQGLVRMTSEAFHHALGLKPGDPYDPVHIRAQYRRLWDLGLFDNITMEAEDGASGGKVLIVKVKEKPVLTSVTYGDNKVLTRTQIEDRLKERKVSLDVGKPLNQKAIFDTESIVRDMLGEKGFLDPEVTHTLDSPTTTTSAVSFRIQPGAKTRIRKIDFVGNQIFSDKKLMSQLKLTRPRRWYWPLSQKNLYHPAKWDQDTGGLRDLYQNSGYLDIEISPPVVELKQIVKTRRRHRDKAPLAEGGEKAPPAASEPKPAGEAEPAGAVDPNATPREREKEAEKRRKQQEKARKKEERAERRAQPKVRRWAYMTVRIQEGPQYRTGKVTLSGNTVLKEEQLIPKSVLREGTILNSGLVDNVVKAIGNAYQNRGYAYATARREIERHEGEPVADVHILVTEDKPYYVSRIEFTGNTSTQDRVLRRELRINEGDLFSRSKLDLSVAKVNQLGYFEVKKDDVIIEPVEGESRVRIRVPGEEKGRNEIQVGGGYSGLDGAFFQGFYSTRNFLGRGQVLSTSIQVGGRSNRYSISFQEPWFLNRPYTLGFSVFRKDIDYSGSLSTSSHGGGVVLGRQLGYFTQAFVGYDYEKISSTGFSLSGATATNEISSITPSISYNRIDNPYRPGRGYNAAFGMQIAGGPLGGDTYYLKPTITGSWFRPVSRKSLLAFHSEVGLVRPWEGGTSVNSATVNGVPRFQRFWLGGDTQGPRVFETRSISPLRYVRVDSLGQIVEAVIDASNRPVVEFDRNGDRKIDRSDLVEMGGDRFFLLQNEYVYGEQVARILRRVHPENKEGITTIRNFYDGNEFIKSTDPLFRPVDQATAPDGTLYIADMYHGIIQESTWSGPGTYLRKRIEQYDLDKAIHHGRVWRLVYDGVKRDRSDALDRDATMPRMNDETPAQLVTHLGHPNGWWRDTAQQLLVLKQDKSIVPTLQNMLKTSTNLLERFHVMWTLEGLGALDAATVRQQMEDKEPRMRIQAIRASETLYKAGDRSFAEDYKRLTNDPSVDVDVQAMLTINRWKVPGATDTIKAVADRNKARGIQLVATTVLNPPDPNAAGRGFGGGRGGGPAFSAADRALIDKGGQIYTELCVACHGADALGEVKPGASGTMAPALSGAPRVNGHRDYITKVVLYGLNGPVDGKTYSELMIPMGTNPDDWVASVASYVRTSFGNAGGLVTAADVKRVRAEVGTRKIPWTMTELVSSLPTPMAPDISTWKVSASHNPAAATGALSLTGWSSQAAQAPGMWFQVELPQAATIAEIQFTSAAGGGRGGGGFGGGGGRGAAPGAPQAAPIAAPVAPALAADAPGTPAAPAAGQGGRGRGAAPGGAAAPGPPPNPGYPRAYKLETSLNGTVWTVAATGQGTGANTTITIKPTPAKFVKLTQTAATESAPPWSITQLRLFEVAVPAKK